MRLCRQLNISGFQSILLGCLLLSGCISAPPAEPNLFVRLGGLPVLTVVIEKTIDRAATEPSTRRSFDGIKLKPVKESIVNYLCQAAGGPCQYEGVSMIKAHGSLAITSAEFDAMIGQLGDTLDQFSVAPREKDELLRLVGRLKDDIVSK